MQSRELHRAGTQNRVYHASVYKLTRHEGQLPIYVCAEYATPLKTLNEVMNRNSTEAGKLNTLQIVKKTNLCEK